MRRIFIATAALLLIGTTAADAGCWYSQRRGRTVCDYNEGQGGYGGRGYGQDYQDYQGFGGWGLNFNLGPQRRYDDDRGHHRGRRGY